MKVKGLEEAESLSNWHKGTLGLVLNTPASHWHCAPLATWVDFYLLSFSYQHSLCNAIFVLLASDIYLLWKE